MRTTLMAILLAFSTLCGCTTETPAPNNDKKVTTDEKEVATTAMPEIRYYVLSGGWPNCNKIVAAVRELEEAKTYESKIKFTIVPPTQEGFAEEVKSFDIGNHGMVAFDSKGKVGTKIPGHDFGKAEIVSAITKLLN